MAEIPDYFDGSCRLCDAHIVAPGPVGDPKLILMARHVRIAHPDAFHGDLAPSRDEILEYFVTRAVIPGRKTPPPNALAGSAFVGA